MGHDAGVDNAAATRKPLLMQDLQHLLAYVLVGDKTPYRPSRKGRRETMDI